MHALNRNIEISAYYLCLKLSLLLTIVLYFKSFIQAFTLKSYFVLERQEERLKNNNRDLSMVSDWLHNKFFKVICNPVR